MAVDSVFVIEAQWKMIDGFPSGWYPLQAICWREKGNAEKHMKEKFIDTNTDGVFRVAEYKRVEEQVAYVVDQHAYSRGGS